MKENFVYAVAAAYPDKQFYTDGNTVTFLDQTESDDGLIERVRVIVDKYVKGALADYEQSTQALHADARARLGDNLYEAMKNSIQTAFVNPVQIKREGPYNSLAAILNSQLAGEIADILNSQLAGEIADIVNKKKERR